MLSNCICYRFILIGAVGGLCSAAESAHCAGMGTDLSEWVAHPVGEQPEVEEWSAVADTFAGRMHLTHRRQQPAPPRRGRARTSGCSRGQAPRDVG